MLTNPRPRVARSLSRTQQEAPRDRCSGRAHRSAAGERDSLRRRQLAAGDVVRWRGHYSWPQISFSSDNRSRRRGGTRCPRLHGGGSTRWVEGSSDLACHLPSSCVPGMAPIILRQAAVPTKISRVPSLFPKSADPARPETDEPSRSRMRPRTRAPEGGHDPRGDHDGGVVRVRGLARRNASPPHFGCIRPVARLLKSSGNL